VHTGQEEYVAMRDQHIRRGQGFILVYSIVQRSTFANVSQIHNQILRVKDDDKVPCVLVGTIQAQQHSSCHDLLLTT